MLLGERQKWNVRKWKITSYFVVFISTLANISQKASPYYRLGSVATRLHCSCDCTLTLCNPYLLHTDKLKQKKLSISTLKWWKEGEDNENVDYS